MHVQIGFSVIEIKNTKSNSVYLATIYYHNVPNNQLQENLIALVFRPAEIDAAFLAVSAARGQLVLAAVFRVTFRGSQCLRPRIYLSVLTLENHRQVSGRGEGGGQWGVHTIPVPYKYVLFRLFYTACLHRQAFTRAC